MSRTYIYMAIHGTQTLVHVVRPHLGQGCYGSVIKVDEPTPNTNISLGLLKLFAVQTKLPSRCLLMDKRITVMYTLIVDEGQ